jgi:hypothetical protein
MLCKHWDVIHKIVEEKKFGKGSEFLLEKMHYQCDDKKISSKLELSLVIVAKEVPVISQTNTLKEIM